jgi:hypothetical protein
MLLTPQSSRPTHVGLRPHLAIQQPRVSYAWWYKEGSPRQMNRALLASLPAGPLRIR